MDALKPNALEIMHENIPKLEYIDDFRRFSDDNNIAIIVM